MLAGNTPSKSIAAISRTSGHHGSGRGPIIAPATVAPWLAHRNDVPRRRPPGLAAGISAPYDRGAFDSAERSAPHRKNTEEATMPVVEAKDGARLNVEIHDHTDPWKHAPTLILQHGFGRSGRFWYNFAPYLSRHYRVACPD